MHLSFRVVLAVVAALTVSMTVNADTDTKCHSKGGLCNSKADCCHGYECVPVLDLKFDEPYYIYMCEK